MSDSTETVSTQKFIICGPKEEASACQIKNEIAFVKYIAKAKHPSIPVPKIYAYNIKQSRSDSPYIALEFIDGHLIDCLWFSLTDPEKASIAYEVADVIFTLNMGGIGCLTVRHSLEPTVEGFEPFRGEYSLSLSGLYQHTAKEPCVG